MQWFGLVWLGWHYQAKPSWVCMSASETDILLQRAAGRLPAQPTARTCAAQAVERGKCLLLRQAICSAPVKRIKGTSVSDQSG